MSSDELDGMSLKMVGVLVFSLVCYLLWGGAAALYKGHVDQIDAAIEEEINRGKANPLAQYSPKSVLEVVVIVPVVGLLTFATNSLVQLRNLPQLTHYMWKERQDYLLFSGTVLTLTGLGMLGMAQVQKSLKSGNPFSKTRNLKRDPAGE